MADYHTYASITVNPADTLQAFIVSLGSPDAVLDGTTLYVNVAQATLTAAYGAFNFAAADLTAAINLKLKALKVEAVRRAGLIYAFINDASIYDFANDLFLSGRNSVAVASRIAIALQPNLAALQSVHDTALTKKAAIQALGTVAAVQAYDVTTGW